MGKFERYLGASSAIMSFLTKVADLIALNALTLIMCLPVFTIGASLTAMYTITGRMVRGDHYYVFKGFFKAFKENFLQATVEWLILLAAYLFLAFDIYIMTAFDTGLPRIMFYFLIAFFILIFIEAQFLFPIQSRFVNPVKGTLRSTVMLATAKFPKAIIMAMCWSIPVLILYRFIIVLPLVLFFGLTVPGILKSYIYTPIFAQFEPEIAEPVSDMDFQVKMDTDVKNITEKTE